MYRHQRKRYPNDWEDLSQACIAQANRQCEQCGIAQDTWVMGPNSLYQIKLNAAHINHDPWNPNPELKALCQPCHFKHDALENGKKARATRYRKIIEAMLNAGQLPFDFFGGLQP